MRPVRFSIKTRFALLAALIVAISSALWGTWVWQNEKRLLFERLEGEGKAMMTSLATPIINALLYEEMGVIVEGGLLDNFVEEIMGSAEFQPTYAFVSDDHGRVLAHNRYTEYGKIYDDPLTVAVLSSGNYRSEISPGTGADRAVLEMAVPLRIYGKTWGALRVGVSTAPLAVQLHELSQRIVTFSVILFIFGTAIFYVVGANLARPLQRLAVIMGAIDPETLRADIPRERSDEIGLLQESFLEMLRRLNRSEEERRMALAHIVQTEKLVTVGKLVAGVAHEVNNPLSGMTTCIHNLESNPAELLKYTDLLRKGLARIETIVRDLSDFSRAGDISLQGVPSDLFFHEAAVFAKLALQKRNVVLVTADDCSPPIILNIDKGKLHQVILNLLFNAADASPPGATVTIRAFPGDGFYCIAVHDQGPGIPEEERRKIFEIFYTTKAPGKGSGMGLAISKSIVEMHEGSLVLDSRDGGTALIVRIPLQEKGKK
ncbi:MAG: ATP-binding protein [Geobacteraceae bacterium]|nr:ATP-binding protein [Geobacteraceae bacterium]